MTSAIYKRLKKKGRHRFLVVRFRQWRKLNQLPESPNLGPAVDACMWPKRWESSQLLRKRTPTLCVVCGPKSNMVGLGLGIKHDYLVTWNSILARRAVSGACSRGFGDTKAEVPG
jgi:hypothetical protein